MWDVGYECVGECAEMLLLLVLLLLPLLLLMRPDGVLVSYVVGGRMAMWYVSGC